MEADGLAEPGRDAAGADRDLESRTAHGELGQHLDRRPPHLGRAAVGATDLSGTDADGAGVRPEAQPSVSYAAGCSWTARSRARSSLRPRAKSTTPFFSWNTSVICV